MVDYGSLWQDMPDYREFSNSHQSAIGSIARALDPMTYIPGVDIFANKAHDAATAGITAGNTALSPLVGGAIDITNKIDPALGFVHKAVPQTQEIDNFVRNKPVDAAGIAAATYFSGGAASGLFEGAGAGTAAAGSLGAGADAAAANAITPVGLTAGESAIAAPVGGAATGLGTIGASGLETGANLLTPASFAGSSSAAPGLLGATGSQFASNAITPSFMQLGGKTPGLLDSFQPAFKALKTANDYKSNLQNFSQPDNSKQNKLRAEMALSDKILNDTPTAIKTKRFVDELMNNGNY